MIAVDTAIPVDALEGTVADVPESPALTMAIPSGKERRRAARRRAHYKVRFWGQDLDANGFVTDVSNTGLFIETRKLPPAGARLHLEIYLTETPFLAEGEVARVQNVPASIAAVRANGFGVRLVTWPEVVDPSRGGAKAAALASVASGTGTEADPLIYDLSDPRRLQTVYTTEICRGGLFVQTGHIVTLGTTVAVTLRLPGPNPELSSKGRWSIATRAPRAWACSWPTFRRSAASWGSSWEASQPSNSSQEIALYARNAGQIGSIRLGRELTTARMGWY